MRGRGVDDLASAVWVAQFLTAAEHALVCALASDWETDDDGHTRPATPTCTGACSIPRRRALSCALDPQYSREGEYCAGFFRSLPAWRGWWDAISAAQKMTDWQSIPRIFVLALEVYDAHR